MNRETSSVANKHEEIDLPNIPNIQAQYNVVRILREQLQQAEILLVDQIKRFQEGCSHDFQKVMKYDQHYSPRVDGMGVGGDVLLGWRCSKCKAFKQRATGSPLSICYKCGGDMKYDRLELCGEDRVHIRKCKSCGHEYDTT